MKPGLKVTGVTLLFGLLLVAGCGSSGNDDEPAGATGETSTTESKPAESETVTSAPVLPEITGPVATQLLQDIDRADQRGMNAEVFAKVGDSNTEWPQNLYGLGCRKVGFGSNGDLKAVVDRYSAVEFAELEALPDCRPVNSLTRRSAAAVSGVWTEWLMTPTAELPATGISAPTEECGPEQTPLDCEIGLLEPRWVLIMTGTNDALLGRPLGETFRGLLVKMIKRVRELGSVPVLSTLPPMAVSAHNGQPGEERIGEANQIIKSVAKENGVPLINLYAALTAPKMVNQGLAGDGLHLGVFGGDNQPDVMRGSAMLTIPALKYGANRRNQIWLQTLDRLDRSSSSGQ